MSETRQEFQVPTTEVSMGDERSRANILRRNIAGISLSAMTMLGVGIPGLVDGSAMSLKNHASNTEQSQPLDGVNNSYTTTAESVEITGTGTTANFSTSASDFVKVQDNFVTPEHIQGTVLKHRIDKKGKSVEVNDCFKMPNGWFWDSYYDAAGKLVWFKDSNPGNAAWACETQITVNGKKQDILEKIRGGMYEKQDGKNGDCGNEVEKRQIVKKAPTPQIVGKIIVEQNLNSFINITATSSVKDIATCSNANGSAEAEAEATAKAVIQEREKAFIDASSSTKNEIFSSITGHSLAEASTEVTGKAIADCQLESAGVATTTTTLPETPTTTPPVVIYVPTPTTTPPPTSTSTTVAQTPPSFSWNALPPAQESFTDGKNYTVCGTATTPNGDTAEVKFWASDGNGSVGNVIDQGNNIYCAPVTISTSAGTDSSFAIDGQVTDLNTGLSSPVEVDNMGTQPMPSLGN